MASNTATEADIIQNKLNLLFASRQRLLESWLPPRTPEELARSKSAEEVEQEEEATFRPIPTRYVDLPRDHYILSIERRLRRLPLRLGVGAPIPKDMVEDEMRRRRPTADDRLRKRLFGKNSSSSANQAGTNSPPTSSIEDESRPARATKAVSDDEEGESRSSLGRSKRKPSASRAQKLLSLSEEVDSATPSKRPHSFLDVMLEKKARKRRRPDPDQSTRSDVLAEPDRVA